MVKSINTKNIMKILVISSNSPEISVGGIERYISNLLDYCENKPDKVIFLLPSSKEKGCEQRNNVVIYRKSFLSPSFQKIFGKHRIPDKETKQLSKQFFYFLLDLFEKEEIDLVYAQNFHDGLPIAYSLLLNMACFSKNIPLILRVHSFPIKDIQISIINYLLWEKIICVSRSVAGDCFKKRVDINKLVTKYVGVNTKLFRDDIDKFLLKNFLGLPKNQKIILHASRIISGQKDILKEKGIITLLEAFSKLGLHHQNTKLLIAIATPPARLKEEFDQALEKLKGYIRLDNLEDRVIYKKFEPQEMPFVYSGSDLFVLASENETFGQVYIEAMACETPVIGTNVGGIPEIIRDNYNGFLIPPNNASILAQKMDELLINNKLRKKFTKNGLKVVNNKFLAEQQFEKLFDYFRQ